MVDVNSSAQTLAHCWDLIMRNCYYYNCLITESYLSLEHPLPSCRTRVLQDPTWVMLTSSNFPILQKEKPRPRESCSLRDSYFEKSVCGSVSSHVTHFHSHYEHDSRTQVWVEIMCLYGKQKYPTTITKALQILPSSQPVTMRQFQ